MKQRFRTRSAPSLHRGHRHLPSLRKRAFVIFALILATSAVASEPEWRLFRAKGFEVEFHGEPEEKIRDETSMLGHVLHHYYWVDRAGAKLDVERHDLPKMASFFLSTNMLLDRIRNDLMKDLGTEMTSEEDISLQGYPGRRVRYSRGEPIPSPEETRFYLVSNTLFVVATGAYVPEARQAIVDRFFASCRIIESDLDD
jgi:hypothetical protein